MIHQFVKLHAGFQALGNLRVQQCSHRAGFIGALGQDLPSQAVIFPQSTSGMWIHGGFDTPECDLESVMNQLRLLKVCYETLTRERPGVCRVIIRLRWSELWRIRADKPSDVTVWAMGGGQTMAAQSHWTLLIKQKCRTCDHPAPIQRQLCALMQHFYWWSWAGWYSVARGCVIIGARTWSHLTWAALEAIQSQAVHCSAWLRWLGFLFKAHAAIWYSCCNMHLQSRAQISQKTALSFTTRVYCSRSLAAALPIWVKSLEMCHILKQGII